MAERITGAWLAAGVAVLLAACGTTAPPLADESLPANSADLIQQLRAGGLNIYMRHAATESGRQDMNIIDLQDCSQQRNLSDLGRRQAEVIGKSFDALAIPVNEVYTSPYCRCRDSARLAFGEERIDPMLLALDSAPNAKERQARVTWLLQRIREEHAGKNIVYVSHQFNIMSAANILLSEGDVAVIRPHGDAGIEVLAKLSAGQWQTLARQAALGQ